MRPHAVLGIYPHALLSEIRRIEDEFLRNYLVFEYFLVVIGIVDEAVQCPQSLLQTEAGLIPFLLGNNARNNIVRPFAIDIASVAVDREGDAHRLNRKIGSPLLLEQFIMSK